MQYEEDQSRKGMRHPPEEFKPRWTVRRIPPPGRGSHPADAGSPAVVISGLLEEIPFAEEPVPVPGLVENLHSTF